MCLTTCMHTARLRELYARIPHSRMASNSSLTNPGSSALDPASVCSMKLTGHVLLHQKVQRGLLREMALVVDRVPPGARGVAGRWLARWASEG